MANMVTSRNRSRPATVLLGAFVIALAVAASLAARFTANESMMWQTLSGATYSRLTFAELSPGLAFRLLSPSQEADVRLSAIQATALATARLGPKASQLPSSVRLGSFTDSGVDVESAPTYVVTFKHWTVVSLGPTGGEIRNGRDSVFVNAVSGKIIEAVQYK